MIRLLLSSVVLAALCSGCYKDIPTIVRVQVLAPGSVEVAGADVRLYVPVDSNAVGEVEIDYSENTGSDGWAEFDLSEDFKNGQTGQYLLEIEVTSGAQSGSSTVKVTPRETTERTVVLN